MPSLDLETVRRSLALARERGLARLDLSVGGTSLAATLLSDWEPAEAEVDSTDDAPAGPPIHVITAAVVGYFRPNSSLSEGDDVEAGQTVGEVVALGISNEIGSPTDGVFNGFLADDGAPVEYGQGVARIQEK